MKANIHPKYNDKAEIRCSCGSIFAVGSTRDSMKTELCSKCHPFYTGQQKLVDTAGRVDKFEAKRKKAQSMLAETKRKQEEKKKKPEAYVEKVIPQEVIERVEAKEKGKWDKPLGESLTEEVRKEDEVKLSKEKKTAKPKAKAKAKSVKAEKPKKPAAKKPSAKTAKKPSKK